ncbi:MAG: NUDIX domain-containing protein [Patescibacteria group bacterium]|jgi:8-oxo-dGTP diphosphatase
MQDTYQTFHVGINILVVKDDRLLLGKRKNVYGNGTWGLPGGHLETGESLKDAAARELSEETDLQVKSFDFSNIVNDRSGGQHRLQIGFAAHQVTGTPIVKEPERCAEWRWFKLNELPSDLFPPHIKQIENFLQKNYFIDA